MHQSFVTTAPSPPPPTGKGRGKLGQSAGQLLFECPRSVGEMTGLTIGSKPQGDFVLQRAGQRAKF